MQNYISLGSDHAAVAFKQTLINYLNSKGYDIRDCGTHSQISCDYPDFAKKVALDVQQKNSKYGILCCGSGIGMSIQANRLKGVRAANVWNVETARLSKQHNNANILCLGVRMHSESLLFDMINTWLSTEFETRHQQRIDKLDIDS